MMDKENMIRKKWLTIRMNEHEYAELIRLSKKTTARDISSYGRDVLLQRPVYVKFRNLSADAFLSEIIALRKEFKAVGFNYNQVVHKMHTLDNAVEFRAWVLVNEKHKELIFSKMKEIQDTLNKIYSLWLQDSQLREKMSEG